MKSKVLLLVLVGLLQSTVCVAGQSDTTTYNEVGAYNEVHKERAKSFKIHNEGQIGDSCVCHTVNNINNALTKQETKISKAVEADCNPSFDSNYQLFKELHKGELFGGQSALTSGKLVDTDEAIIRIEQALDEGKVVAVSLNAKPIYDDYSKRNNIDYQKRISDKFMGIHHAIVVIGLERTKSGMVSSFIIADSSGPNRKYYVDTHVFREAYHSKRTLLARGVFIPDQAVHTKIAYRPEKL